MNPDRKSLDKLRINRDNAPRRGVGRAFIAMNLIVAAGGGGAAWWINRPTVSVVRTATIRVSTAGEDRTLLNASGYVTARRLATVSSKVTGKVIEVLVEEGMRVTEGQVLASLDAANVEKSLLLAEAQLESARKALGETQANLDNADFELRRITRLASENAASDVEVDRAETIARALRARIERQSADIAVGEAELALWRQQLDDAVIRAPFDGVVTSKNAQPGEMISPMSAGGGFTRTGICTLVDMTSLEIEVDVSESYINRVEAGQPVIATLDSYPQWRIPAKVIAIIPTADRQKATVKVRVAFEELDPRILPDMSVKVAFQSTGEAGEAASIVTAPKAAIRQRDGRDIVWIVRDGRVERRAVTIGATSGDDATITAGVSGGERVVIEGPADLADGDRVTESTQ